MIKGFNNILPLLRRLLAKGNEMQADAFAEYLQDIPANEKALRFPAGTGSKTYIHDQQLTDRFSNWSEKAGIEYMSLVVNDSDEVGFLNMYSSLSHFDIISIEYKNEDYIPSHVRAGLKLFSQDWVLSVFAYPQLLKKRAKQYGVKYAKFVELCHDSKIDIPISFVVDMPKGYQSSIWFNESKKYTDHIIIHSYGSDRIEKSLNKLKGKIIDVTEFKGIHFGDSLKDIRNEEKSHTSELIDIQTKHLGLFESVGVRSVYEHCLFDIDGDRNNLYHRFLLKGTEIIDRHKNLKS